MVGRKLKELRTDRSRWGTHGGYTLAQVAEVIGVTESAVSRYESGDRAVPVRVLAAWLDLLRASDAERAALLVSE